MGRGVFRDSASMNSVESTGTQSHSKSHITIDIKKDWKIVGGQLGHPHFIITDLMIKENKLPGPIISLTLSNFRVQRVLSSSVQCPLPVSKYSACRFCWWIAGLSLSLRLKSESACFEHSKHQRLRYMHKAWLCWKFLSFILNQT